MKVASGLFCSRKSRWGLREEDTRTFVTTEPDGITTVVPIPACKWFYTRRHLEVVLKGMLMRSALHEAAKRPDQRTSTHNGTYDFNLRNTRGSLRSYQTYEIMIRLNRFEFPFPEPGTMVQVDLRKREEYRGRVVPATSNMMQFDLRMFVHRIIRVTGMTLDENSARFRFGPQWASPQFARTCKAVDKLVTGNSWLQIILMCWEQRSEAAA